MPDPAPSAPTPAADLDGRFVHLHLHSQYSLLDGGNRLDRLVKRVKDLGMDAVAVTDHGNLHAAAEFYLLARDHGLKPILGIEAYVAPDLGGKPSDRTSREYTGVSDGGFHLVLLAENNAGWANLLKLSSDAFLKGFYFKPRMDKTTLAQWSRGLIAINGHLGSSIAHYLVQFHRTKDPAYWKHAVAEAQWHKQVFAPSERGQPCFYLEMQRHEEKLQDEINPYIAQLAAELDIPLVCDNDAHFLTAQDWDAHDTLCCISMGKTKQDTNRLRYPRDLYVKSPQEMWESFGKDHPEALRNTVRIAERCNVELDFKANHAPVVKVVRRESSATSRDREGAVPSGGSAEAKNASGDRSQQASSGRPAKERDRSLTVAARTASEGSTEWFKQFCSQYELVPFDAINDKETPEELADLCDQALRELCEAGLVWRYGRTGITDAIRARLDRELKVLGDKRISAYFLIVWDFVNYARQNGIPANARGSGVGTMVGYVLGLSNACPVEYGLLFERFTDPDRSEYPDIDIDMCQDGRGAVIDYVRRKYGHVAQIITFGTLKARAAVRDVGRVLNVSLGDVDKVCKLIGDGLKTTLDSAWEQEPDLKSLCTDQPALREMYDTARRLEGFTRHAGVHAAGVIVATRPLDTIVPLYKPSGNNAEDTVVTQWDGPTCEKVGLLKMDFLGLRTLSIIERAKLLITQTLDEQTIADAVSPTSRGREGAVPSGGSASKKSASGDRSQQASDEHPANAQDRSLTVAARTGDPRNADPLDLERLTYDDPRVFALFARGETAGVFQFESGGMRNLLMAMKPDRLSDLIAANALFRPGPMELIPNYVQRKHGREQVPTLHAIVDRLTAETYGIMVYQEQVMQVLNELGGIALRQAYTIIKAISKKKEKTINEARADFIQGAATQGVNEKQSGELFDLILKFAGYGFNKSHSTGYAIVAYQTAYLKTHFPLHYMAAVLTYESVSTDKVVEYIEECKKVLLPSGGRGIEVRPPDINLSDVAFTVVYGDDEKHEPSSGHIRFGLSAIKGVGEKAMRAVIAEREKGGPFKGIYDFCERVPPGNVNRATLEALIKCGAFDSLYGVEKRSALCEVLDNALKAGQRVAQDRASGQLGMFGMGLAAEPAEKAKSQEPALPSAEAWSQKQTLDHEKEVMGLYVSSHPLMEVEGLIERFSSVSVEDCRALPAEQNVTVGGMLTRVRPTFVKQGRSAGAKMAMITIADAAGHAIEGVCFADAYATCSNALQLDAVVFIEGKIDRRREEANLIVNKVIPVEQATRQLTRAVKIVVHEQAGVDRREALAESWRRLREVLREASHRANGSSADVMLELHTGEAVVEMRLPSVRVSADDVLIGGVRAVLNGATGREVRCELVGPAKVNRRAAIEQYGPVRATGELVFAMQDDSGESIERY